MAGAKVKKVFGVNIVDVSKAFLMSKVQGVFNYPKDTLGKESIYTQGNTKPCGVAHAVVYESVDYFSGWTSTFNGPWDAFTEEMIKDHTQYDNFNCPIPAEPDFFAEQSKTDSNHRIFRPTYRARGAPYPHTNNCLNPTFTQIDAKKVFTEQLC